MNNKVILIGGFHEIIELLDICAFEIFGIIDNHLKDDYYGIKILGTDSDVELLQAEIISYPLVISPDRPDLRKKLWFYYSKLGFSFQTIISPLATTSKTASILKGVIVQSGVNISSNTKIGKFAKLNTRANIMHDVTIGEYTTIAPNAVVLGNVSIGSQSYIGANATILPGIKIGDKVLVGAGSVVTKDISSNSIVKGIPAK